MITITHIASGSSGNCYHVTDGITQLLLEAGIRYKTIQKKLNFAISELSGCLVTHEHGDHSKSAQELMRAGVDVYMSLGTYTGLFYPDGSFVPHRFKMIKSLEQFKIGTWTILPFDTVHDATEPLGFLLSSTATGEKLLFATDTAYLRFQFTALTHIMIECNYVPEILSASNISRTEKRRITFNHFGLDNVVKFLEDIDKDRLVEVHLLHLSDRNADENPIKERIEEVVDAKVVVAER